MSSAVDTNKLRTRIAQRTYIHDPADATIAAKIAWVPLSTYENFMVTATLVSGTGILTFKIFAAEDSSGTNPVEVKAHATPTVADAQGDQLVLECSAAELPPLAANLTHVSAELDCDVNTDIVAVTYTRAIPRYATDGLTDDVIS
jgi:hypothetical protein